MPKNPKIMYAKVLVKFINLIAFNFFTNITFHSAAVNEQPEWSHSQTGNVISELLLYFFVRFESMFLYNKMNGRSRLNNMAQFSQLISFPCLIGEQFISTISLHFHAYICAWAWNFVARIHAVCIFLHTRVRLRHSGNIIECLRKLYTFNILLIMLHLKYLNSIIFFSFHLEDLSCSIFFHSGFLHSPSTWRSEITKRRVSCFPIFLNLRFSEDLEILRTLSWKWKLDSEAY